MTEAYSGFRCIVVIVFDKETATRPQAVFGPFYSSNEVWAWYGQSEYSPFQCMSIELSVVDRRKLNRTMKRIAQRRAQRKEQHS